MIKERIEALKNEMKKRNITVYLVPTADFHESEYVGDHFKARKYITGFSGSAGTAVVTYDQTGLWTDGRYFIQAAKELEGTGVTLFKMAEENVPTVEEYIESKLNKGGILGFDGRVINTALGEKLKGIAEKKGADIYTSEDLIDIIWKNRPALSHEKGYILDEKYTGRSYTDKVAEVRSIMKKSGADVNIMTSLDDINWLYNIRGNDIEHFPVVLAFSVITDTESVLFVQSGVLSDEILKILKSEGVTVKGYDEVSRFVSELPAGCCVMLDKTKVNYSIYSSLPSDAKIIHSLNPAYLMKCIKNTTELNNLRNAHIKDGVAFTKFMYWLKNNVGKIPMDEVSASDYLEQRRREQEGFLDISFDTICAYNDNAAMMHYKASPESAAKIDASGLLLVDSGGHYYEGSTDITRTMVLGPIPDEWKFHFTTVCRSMLNLSAARFLHGCTGVNLDILCRGPLWDLGIDYRCGTGHGVGYILNIHEGPNGFRWRVVPERMDNAVLEEGMVTTDEPGVYIENSHGIRTENELICRKGEKNEYGQFMYFEMLTYAPIDLDGIDTKYMTKKEISLLNDYHALVYEKLSPYMTSEEKEWLKHATRKVE